MERNLTKSELKTHNYAFNLASARFFLFLALMALMCVSLTCVSPFLLFYQQYYYIIL